MKVSIQIPVYQTTKYLAEALDSVYRQTYSDYEIIVVDDGSKENIQDVLENYPQVRYIRQEHKGVSAARNCALRHAEGDLIAFLDADDLWTEEKLGKQVAYLMQHPECELVFCGVANFSPILPDAMTKRQRQMYQTRLANYLVSSCVRRQVFEQYGMYQIDYSYGEDTELMARWAAAGVSLEHRLDEALYLRRIHDENMSLLHEKVGKKEYLEMMAAAVRKARKKEV